ncbi:MAG: hypothetical protein ABSG43_29615 [Solirubrobacteraceae bacterium]
MTAVCAAGLAACGAARNQGATSAGVSANSGVRFAACIRANGVPDFPDPGGAFPPGFKHQPAFQTAMKTCLKLEPPGSSTGKHFSLSQRLTALAQVRCIREQGLPNFPDPTFPASGGELFPAIAGFNPASPAFRHAAAACGLNGSIGQPHGG